MGTLHLRLRTAPLRTKAHPVPLIHPLRIRLLICRTLELLGHR